MADIEHVDAVILGANIRGLVTAHMLDALGYKAVLIERSNRLGGADGSFQTEAGTWFDNGLHVVDVMRSPVTTRLFKKVVDGAVNIRTLRRAIVLRNEIMPYAPTRDEMPESLRAMLPDGELVDELGDALPTRAALAKVYGDAFTDLIFDEVLPSYPTEHRHTKFGVEEGELMPNVYPWFFPRAQRPEGIGDASRTFHDKLRAGVEQQIMYPKAGRFGAFAESFASGLQNVELITGASDVHLEVEAGTHRVSWAAGGGRKFSAPQYFWAGPWPVLCGILDLPCQNVVTDRVVVGSFRFDRAPTTEFHELLVGDPSHSLNRAYFPGRFRDESQHLMQIEFSFPQADERSLDPEEWLETWLQSCKRLGIIGDAHVVEEFDFRSFPIHFNAFGMEGERLIDADPVLLSPDSNVHPVAPSMGNWNLNTYVPMIVAQVPAVLARG